MAVMMDHDAWCGIGMKRMSAESQTIREHENKR